MNESTDKRDEEFAKRAKAMFDDSVERLDGATLSQLNQRRQAALAELSTRDAGIAWGRWMPATGAVAAAAVVAVMLLQGPEIEIPANGMESAATDFEILTGDDELDMIEELEFYAWIELAELEAGDNVG